MENNDTRTMSDLAREALAAQNACNLSGVVHSFSRAISRLRTLNPGIGTDALNQHPICKVWTDKMADLSGSNLDTIRAYCEVEKLAEK